MKKTVLRCAFLAALGCGLSAPASAGDLKLTMQDGRVTIIAVDVPLRQILQEWARVGQAKIVNGDKLNGPSITLQLINAPERDALDILLRSASGYIAAPRPVPMAGAAMYDRVTIMASSRAPAMTAGNPPPPTFQRPPQPMDDSDDPINSMMMPPPNPVVGQYPGMLPPGMSMGPNGQPMLNQPGQATPMTSPRPGALPAPQLPAGAPNPYQPVVRQPVGPGGRAGGPGGPGGN
jgi:hypothetical protein